MSGLEPVLVRRSLRTASGLPQRMSQLGDVLAPKGCDAVFIHGGPMRLLGMLVSLLGVFQSLPGALLPGLVVLLFMGLGGAAMSVGGLIVKFGRALMIFVVRSVVIA